MNLQSFAAYTLTASNEQLERLYWRIYHRMSAGGGTCYGIDWPTMHVLHPHLTQCLRLINAEGRARAMATGRSFAH